MGVPMLFRWLESKYTGLVYPAKPQNGNLELDERVDNLYLDMNGIVHPCTHPHGRPSPTTEADMFTAIFTYTDHVVRSVSPRKLLFIALDGVAPRAKMNQQRTRRFRAARDTMEHAEGQIAAQIFWEDTGRNRLTEEDLAVRHWDYNAITPGTPFMERLAQSLRDWVKEKMVLDPLWTQLNVILSDASVPGEGEHKIMEFVREQRLSEGHRSNTRHVVYGLDADLIMLSLATHERHFRILRESSQRAFDVRGACRLCGQDGHSSSYCDARTRELVLVSKTPAPEVQFLFLDIALLRLHLERELHVPDLPFQFDPEKAFDDWTILLFLVGNDFLPHLPSLDISDGAIDILVDIWKQELPSLGGYMSDDGVVHIQRLLIVLQKLGRMESQIFIARKKKERNRRKNEKNHQRRNRKLLAAQPINAINITPVLQDTPVDVFPKSSHHCNDSVQLFNPGYEDRYYQQKFGIIATDIVTKQKICSDYVEGLAWVFRYYFQGVPSWSWYYPHYYAPFAADLGAMKLIDPAFELGVPFSPLEQLMSVLPAASHAQVPIALRGLMLNSDSPISDFYPAEFPIDMDGKRQDWQGVALLPFIDYNRLVQAMATRYGELSHAEMARNVEGHNVLFVSKCNPLFRVLCNMLQNGSVPHKLFASDGYNLSGRLSLCSKETPSIPDADVISVVFELLSPVGQNQLDLLAGVCLTQDSFPHEKQKRDETCAGIDYVGNKDEGSSVHSSRGEKSSVRKRCRAASAPEEVQQPTNRHKIG